MDGDYFVQDFELFINECRSKESIILHKALLSTEKKELTIYFIESDVICARINIFSNFTVSAFSYNSKIDVRDLLGFQCRLFKWSQLEAIISRVKNSPIDLKNEIKYHAKILQSHADSCPDVDKKTDFLINQLQIASNSRRGRSYSSSQILNAARIYLSSRAGYKQCRKFLYLPHPNTIKSHLGGLSSPEDLESCKSLIETAFSFIEHKFFTVIFDEMYVKPSVRYRGSHLIGKSADNSKEAARTILAIMIKPIADGKSFIVRLIPVHTLKPQFLFQQLETVIKLIVESGGHVSALVSDNHMTNRRCYKIFQGADDCPWHGYSSSGECSFILLFDSVHLLKSIRNNWITEGRQEIEIQIPGSETPTIGKWSDICTIEAEERQMPIRTTKLDYSSCFPTPIARQKVNLVLNVFNEKTVAALKIRGKHDTAKVVDIILKLWKLVNVKNPLLYTRLADDDRRPFSSVDDQRLKLLQSLAHSFMNMPGGRGASRVHSLTWETKNALFTTLMGTVELIRRLLSKFQYVLTAKLQSDDLEGEFGVYRQLSGGVYFVGVEQVLSSANLRTRQFMSRLGQTDILEHKKQVCCHNQITDSELDLLDHAVQTPDLISKNESLALYYICGYVAKKENLLGSTISLSQESEFTSLVSRGFLIHPSEELFELSRLLYSVFLSVKPECCNRFCELASIVYEMFFDKNFENPTNVFRRFGNCFFKGLCRKESEHFNTSYHDSLKRVKLTRH